MRVVLIVLVLVCVVGVASFYSIVFRAIPSSHAASAPLSGQSGTTEEPKILDKRMPISKTMAAGPIPEQPLSEEDARILVSWRYLLEKCDRYAEMMEQTPHPKYWEQRAEDIRFIAMQLPRSEKYEDYIKAVDSLSYGWANNVRNGQWGTPKSLADVWIKLKIAEDHHQDELRYVEQRMSQEEVNKILDAHFTLM